ncbi:MAG: hypothetical protein ACLFWM_09195 [Actinomycetota bacterium]
MRRLLVLAAATLTMACSGALGLVPIGERSTEARVAFPEDGTLAAGPLLAFDPSRHSLDIEVALPLEQSDDIDIFIITSNGIRFQILSSFQGCHVDGPWRRCDRHLPVLPEEGVDNWRVEAERSVAVGASSVEVDVTWVPLGS